MKRIYAFFLPLLFLAPLSAAQISDDEKSPDISDHYTISNPLVLLVGVEKYLHPNFDDLPGVESDMKILHSLFSMKCGYEVRSTYHKGDTYVGKVVKKKDLDRFLRLQYNYLHDQRDVYDALIFVFSGHGDRTCYGNDTIITSDGKDRFFMDVVMKFTPKDDDEFSKSFAYKPKLFFKLACRGKGRPKYIKQSKRIRGDSEFVSAGSEVFIACATSPEYSMYDSSRATFSNILSSFISKYLGNKKGHLSDIDREIRMGLAKKEAPRSTTGLTKKVFFSPKIKRKPLDEQTEEKWWDALQNGGEKTVKHILAHYNVDVNTKDNDGETPLYYAARYNSIEVAEILIAKGTDVNAKNKKEWTPLNLAADADKSIRNNKNKTPLDLARKWHRKEMIGLLK